TRRRTSRSRSSTEIPRPSSSAFISPCRASSNRIAECTEDVSTPTLGAPILPLLLIVGSAPVGRLVSQTGPTRGRKHRGAPPERDAPRSMDHAVPETWLDRFFRHFLCRADRETEETGTVADLVFSGLVGSLLDPEPRKSTRPSSISLACRGSVERPGPR